jgi:hypothetical protein
LGETDKCLHDTDRLAIRVIECAHVKTNREHIQLRHIVQANRYIVNMLASVTPQRTKSRSGWGGLGRWAEDLPKKHAPKLQIPFFSISLLGRLVNPGSWYEWFVDRSRVDSSTCSTNRRNVNNEAPHMFSASTPVQSKAAQVNVAA